MRFVLDTNVISEVWRPIPNSNVLQWFRKNPRRDQCLTAITVAELLSGVERMVPGRRRRDFDGFVNRTVRHDFRGRILPFDCAAAEVYAVLSAERVRSGRPVATPDLYIAAIALDAGAVVVTRNVDHFLGFGLDVLDPWSA